MKFLFVLNLLLKVVSGNANEGLLSIAFVNITRALFQLETRMLVQNYGVKAETLSSMVLKSLNENAMPYQLNNLKMNNRAIFLNSSALLTFDSAVNLKKFNHQLVLNNEFYKPLQLFVFCPGARLSDILPLAFHSHRKAESEVQGNFNKESGMAQIETQLMNIIQYEYFLIEEKEFFRLATFVWLSPAKCGEWQLIGFNKFDKKTAKWKNDIFSVDKLESFYGCEIVVDNDVQITGPFYAQLVPAVLERSLNYKLIEWEKRKNVSDRVDLYIERACFNAFDRYEELFDVYNRS